jgi:hypothetical protein
VRALSPGREARAAASYRGLFAEPVLRRLALADACARLPQGMVAALAATALASARVTGCKVAASLPAHDG